MSAYDSIAQFSKMLKNLDAWLGKAEEHAKTKGFDAEVFVKARLAPDQYELVKQVQSACDAAKFVTVYLTGKPAPVFEDNEKTMAELHARIAGCRAVLDAVSEKDLEGWAAKKVSPPWMGGKWVRGDHYLHQLAIPNFHFHVVTAYSILRHNGVPLGKTDYIGGLPMND